MAGGEEEAARVGVLERFRTVGRFDRLEVY